MNKQQFLVLYRDFLFRMVDLELLSAHAQGDINRLLGQFASLLVLVSVLLALGAMGGASGIKAWPIEHLLISNTMLVVGLFAVLSWDSAFPDRREVLVLTPLPVRPGLIFLGKAAALATALGITVATLNCATGLLYPLSWMPDSSGIFGLLRASSPTGSQCYSREHSFSVASWDYKGSPLYSCPGAIFCASPASCKWPRFVSLSAYTSSSHPGCRTTHPIGSWVC